MGAAPTAQIVALARKNTNVRSLSLSLDHKLKALDACNQLLLDLEGQVHGDMGRGSR